MSQWQRSIGVCFTALLCAPAAQASEGKFIGSQSCNSTSCHGRSEPRKSSLGPAGVGLQEFQLYARHDPHANAGRTLMSPEFQAIFSRVSATGSGRSPAAEYQKCAACHDPEGMFSAEIENADLAPPELGHSTAGRGISCETCHGGAKEWLTTHYQRDASRPSLVAAGMRDTKDLAVRADLCASCHVGGAGRDVNHDLLAAGHPPLRFELAAYHRKLTNHGQGEKQSHWNDARERMATREFEIQLWDAGQSAAAKAALGLLADRAKRAARAESESGPLHSPWPEFAEYDCFGCHQKLRPSDAKKLELGGDFATWGEWNFPRLQTPAHVQNLDSLRQEMHKGFAAQPKTVENLANQTILLFPMTPGSNTTADSLLQSLQQPPADSASWEDLCQRYLALRAIQKCSGDEFQKLELAGKTSPDERSEFNGLRSEMDHDLGAIGRELSFADDTREWPRVLSDPVGLKSADRSLVAAAEKMRGLYKHIERKR